MLKQASCPHRPMVASEFIKRTYYEDDVSVDVKLAVALRDISRKTQYRVIKGTNIRATLCLYTFTAMFHKYNIHLITICTTWALKHTHTRTHMFSWKTDLQTVMRFFRSTATFRAEAFFETSPMAIAACTQPDSIQQEAALISKDPSLSATGPPHSLLDAREDAARPHQSR